MGRKIIMGIDTSNYTTSVALMYTDGELIANLKRPLTVKSGERGLRQSDAVFSHIKNIPSLMDEVRLCLGGEVPAAVGVSSRPRNKDGSYMPCFLSGVAAAQSISAALGIPLYRFSHQCGHIMAAIYSSHAEELIGREHLAFHISGGTTELLTVKGAESGFVTEIVGGTLDINAGQLIDRTGVRLGLDFPAGAALEALALSYSGKRRAERPALKGCYFNLSGLENKISLLIDKGERPEYIADYTLCRVSEAICAACEAYISENGDMPIVFAGGVMSNSIIKKELSRRFTAYFAEPAMSADNAVGIAELARREYIKE
ncbi:MAG: peptidase M22 [Clostridia bacterium]|nr:peptidase M22 [Clostridia bacterium]